MVRTKFPATMPGMQPPSFTLAAPCSHQVDIRKSRFLAQVVPVSTTEQAMLRLHELSLPEANHNCWAWRIGQEYRFNDDGEPSGSAGRPILTAIDGQGLDGVLAVVTRWFGGIKLGVGGLVRAYGGTAAECMRLAEHVPIIAMLRMHLECGYADLPLLKSRMDSMQADIRDEQFGALGVRLELDLPEQHHEELARLLRDVTRGQGTLQLAE